MKVDPDTFEDKYTVAMGEIVPLYRKHFESSDELMIALANALAACFDGNPNIKLSQMLVQALAECHNENVRNFIMMAQPQGSA
jgi:hypothetical protein